MEGKKSDGESEIDAQRRVNHTDTAGCNVRCNHDGAIASLEFVEDPIALVLLLVAVNCCGQISVRTR